MSDSTDRAKVSPRQAVSPRYHRIISMKGERMWI